jgi:excinuclease UvrABC ATPase subunit
MDIIKCFCEEKGINSNKTFREISDEERNLILNGIGKKKHKIKYTRVGRLSVRNTEYYGVLTGKTMLPDFKMSGDFFGNNVCSVCNGQKYSSDHKNYIVNGLSIGEVMCIDFQELRRWVINIQKKTTGTNLEFSFQHIANFVQKAIDLNLGHLYFNRTIPSLSGGELQRLRLIQVFNTQLTDVLIILDEPLAGISGEEEIKIYQNIKKLSEKHTLLIVDHHNIFYKDAAQIIALGPLSGKFGGEIIDTKKYISSQNKPLYIIAPKEEESIIIKYKNAIYNYKGCNIRLSKKRLNMITGSSGVGKSTLLREYFSQYLENYKYINQKPLFGTGNSLVATVLDIANLIIDDFSKQNKVEKKLFFSGKGDKGVCPSCGGTGYVVFGNDYDTELKLLCKDCEGAGFNIFLKKFKVRGKTIFDVWNMTINEAYIFYQEYNKKISQKLNDAIEIMLGHLLIGQKTKL